MTSDRRFTVAIVDDEPHARAELRALVSEIPWLETAAEAANGIEAVRVIDETRPDVVFLDVQMPGASGLEVLQRCTHEFEVVFTTAYSEHALAAFDCGALDYLMKPFSDSRFHEAVERVKRRLDSSVRERSEQLHDILLDGLPARRVFVKRRGELVAIDADSIVRFQADGDYVRLFTSEGVEYLIYTRLGDLTERLDPARFLRVHRSHVVNLMSVVSIQPREGGRFELSMADGSRVESSRRRSARLRELVL